MNCCDNKLKHANILVIEGEMHMDTLEMLDLLQQMALKDEYLKDKLLNTRNEKDPLSAFCSICREAGVELYEMDIICAGEDFHAAMKRSTNGGGENSPKMGWNDDFYELFLAGIEK